MPQCSLWHPSCHPPLRSYLSSHLGESLPQSCGTLVAAAEAVLGSKEDNIHAAAHLLRHCCPDTMTILPLSLLLLFSCRSLSPTALHPSATWGSVCHDLPPNYGFANRPTHSHSQILSRGMLGGNFGRIHTIFISWFCPNKKQGCTYGTVQQKPLSNIPIFEVSK